MSLTKFEHSLAIVIGINDYQDGVPILKTPVNDAQTLAKILEKEHCYEIDLRLNQKANREDLITLFKKELPERLGANDRLLFYFAGHGIALHGEDGPEGYLIPQNARLGDISTYLSMSQVHKALIQLPCPHFLGILDCCFAGSFSWSSTRKLVSMDGGVIHRERFERFIQDPAWQMITSAAYDQTALDAFSDALNLQGHRGQAGAHSPFAAALIEALQGEADAYPPAKPGKPARDGVITATELYLYLRDHVEVATETRALRQTPGIHHLKKHDKGEYIFLAPGHELNLPPAPPLDESKNPYRGLQPFEENHSELFFGRSELIEKLHDFVKTHPLTVVLGTSGSGKSSLVKAGLIPKLKQDVQETHAKWCILSPVRPGETPFQALNNALVKARLVAIELQNPHKTLAQSIEIWAERNPKAQLLIFIDQSEELITLCSNETERQEFFQQILTAIDAHPERLRVVLSLRSDFEPQIRDTGLKFAPEVLNKLGQAKLKNRWQRGRFIVPVMTRAELREAIEKPAEAQIMYFQPHDLVEQIVDEVADMPGALPLLSFALSQLYLKYLRRQQDAQNRGVTIDRALTQEDYQDLGGVIQSLTQRANEKYQALVEKDPAYAQIVRHVMLRMITLGGGELARRQVPLSELEYPPEKNGLVKEVIERFTNARLLVKGEDAEGNLYVEPAHDALVRGWQRLLEWKQENEESLILQRRLTPSAVEWESLKSKEQPSGFQAKVEPIVDRLDRKLYRVENLFNQTITQLAQLWRRKQNQQERSKEKSVQFLWNANPYLDVLNENLNASDNWFNQVEAKFVQESVLQKRRNISWRGRVTLGIILTLSSLALWALAGQRNAQIGQIMAFAETSEAEWRSNQDLDAVINALRASKTLDKLFLPFGLFKPDAELAQVRGTLQKIVYTQRVKEYNSLEEDGGALRSVVFSPDGQTIAVASDDNTVTVWNLRGIKLQTLRGHNGEVKSVAFSPDGQTIASASEDTTVKLWKRDSTGQFETQPDQTLIGHTGSVTSVTFSPDGQTIASASEDTTVKLWKRDSTGQFETQPDQALTGHTNSVTSVTFSPDGQTIASASEDTTVKLWNIEGQELQTLSGHSSGVTSVAFSPDGQMLVASATSDKTIKLWKRDNRINQFVTQPDIIPNEYIRSIRSVAFSPDGQILALATEDRTVVLLNLQGSVLQTLTGHTSWVFSVAFSPDKKTFTLASSSANTVKLWRFEDEKLPTLSNVHDAAIWRIALSPNGEMLASASLDGTVKLWKWDDSTDQFETQPYKTLDGHNGYSVRSIAFSPDGQTIATASDDTTVKLWSIEGQELQTLTGHKSSVYSVAFSPDGQIIATASGDKTIKLWKRDNSTGQFETQPYKTLTGHNNEVLSVAFSPDGQTIATASRDKTIKLWSLNESKEPQTLTGHKDEVNSVVFSPDGKLLASASFDKTIKLWQRGFSNRFETQPYKTLTGHTTWVTDVAFSSDGKMLASASEDTTVKLWTSEGQELQTLYGHGDGNWIRSIAFRPNDKKIVSAGAGKIILWNLEDLSLDKLLEPACNWVHDYLRHNPDISDRDRHLCDDVN